MKSILGIFLRQKRASENSTIGDMAKILGMKITDLSGLECGKRPVPEGFLSLFAERFDLNPTEVGLFGEVILLAKAMEEMKCKQGDACPALASMGFLLLDLPKVLIMRSLMMDAAIYAHFNGFESAMFKTMDAYGDLV